MTVLTSTMRMQLDAAGFIRNAKQLAEALDKDVKRIDALKTALKETGGSDRLQASMVKLGASTAQVEGVRRALVDFRKEQGLVGKSWGDLTREQKAALRTFESATVATVRTIIGEEKDLTAAVKREADYRSAALLATEQKLREQILAQDAKAENRRIAMLAAAAGGKAEAAKREVAVRAAIEAEITAKLRTEVRARVAASEQEALTIERIAGHEKELRIRAIQAETSAIVAARHQQAEAEAHAMQHAQNRAGFRHFALTGIAASVSAHGVVSGGERVLEAGAERQSERVLMKNAGISPAEIVRIEDQALRLSTAVGNVSQTKVMETAKELRSMIADPSELGKVLDPIIRAKSVLDAMDTTGASSEGIGQLLKAGELVGAAKDPERLTKLIDGWVKVMQVSGKTVNPEQIFEFVKYSKTAGATLSDRFLTTVGPSILQELGGSTTGNDIAMMSKTIATGFGKNHTSMREAARIGLINPDDIDYLKTGEAKGLKPGREHAVRGDSLFQTDPDKWVYEVLIPHLEAAGIKTQEAQLAFVQKTFTGTSADFIAKTITQRQAYDTHAENYGKAAGLGATGANAQSAAVGLNSLTTAIGNLSANVSVPLMEPIGIALNNAAGWINKLAEVAKDNPITAAFAGVVAGGAALAGSGYLSWKVLGGMQISAARTQIAAAEMQLAAAEKSAGSTVVKTVEDAAAPGAAAVTAGGIIARLLPPIALTIAAIEAGKWDQKLKEDTAKTWNTPQAQALPDMDKQSWGEWFRGALPGHADGGVVRGAGGSREDRVVARLSPGEFVINASATARHRGLLEAINAGTIDLPAYAAGGAIGLSRDALGRTGGVVPVSLATDSSSASALREVFFDAMYEALKRARDEADAVNGGGPGGSYGGGGGPSLRYGRSGSSAGLPSLRYGHAAGGHYRDAPEHVGKAGHYRHAPAHGQHFGGGAMPQGDGTDPSSLKGVLFKGESGGNPGIYNHRVGGRYAVGHFDASKMTVGDLMKAQAEGGIFAAGKYQIIPQTMKGAVSALGLKSSDRFDSATQDRIYTDYLAGSKRPQISNFVTGKSDSLDAAHKALAQEWASVAYHGHGMYDRDGVNHASVSDAAAESALQKARETYKRLVAEGVDPDTARRSALLGIQHPKKADDPQRAAEKAVLPKKLPTAGAVPGPMSEADPAGGATVDHSSIREATHHVRELKRELASLGTAHVGVTHSGFGHAGGHSPGAVRTALNGNFGSDGRWS